jgi:hypothetical protein
MAYADAESLSELLEEGLSNLRNVEHEIASGNGSAFTDFVQSGTILEPLQGKNLEVELYNPRTNNCGMVYFYFRGAMRPNPQIVAFLNEEHQTVNVEGVPTLLAMLLELLGPWQEIDTTVINPFVVKEEGSTPEE